MTVTTSIPVFCLASPGLIAHQHHGVYQILVLCERGKWHHCYILGLWTRDVGVTLYPDHG